MNKPTKVVHIAEEEILRQLEVMELDDGLRTPSEPTDNPEHTSHNISFKDKHWGYLKNHPKVNPEFYLSNLRAMIKIRP